MEVDEAQAAKDTQPATRTVGALFDPGDPSPHQHIDYALSDGIIRRTSSMVHHNITSFVVNYLAAPQASRRNIVLHGLIVLISTGGVPL